MHCSSWAIQTTKPVDKCPSWRKVVQGSISKTGLRPLPKSFRPMPNFWEAFSVVKVEHKVWKSALCAKQFMKSTPVLKFPCQNKCVLKNRPITASISFNSFCLNPLQGGWSLFDFILLLCLDILNSVYSVIFSLSKIILLSLFYN